MPCSRKPYVPRAIVKLTKRTPPATKAIVARVARLEKVAGDHGLFP